MNDNYPTAYPELNDVLQELVYSVQGLLEENFLGAYLQGSFAVGDYDRHSDVDFVIVTESELPDNHILPLQVMHARIFDLDSPWAQHPDGSYFPKEVLRFPPRPGKELWYLDNGSSELVKSTHCNTLVVRWVVREHGVTLTGPSPKTLVDPVPVDELHEEIREVISEWGEEILSNPERFKNRFYQSFIVLSYCRMGHNLRTGSIGSKRTGSEWAKMHLDPSWRGLIDRTWDARPNPEVTSRQPADKEDFERTLAFVRYAIELSKEYISL
jgi:hypothetical protein